MTQYDDSRKVGTIILSKAARERIPELKRHIRAVDGSLDLREGDDFVIGRRRAGDWEPGMPLSLSRPPKTTQHAYVATRGRQRLRLSHA